MVSQVDLITSPFFLPFFAVNLSLASAGFISMTKAIS